MLSSQLECSKPMNATRVSSKGGQRQSHDKNDKGRWIQGRRRECRFWSVPEGRLTDWVPRNDSGLVRVSQKGPNTAE